MTKKLIILINDKNFIVLVKILQLQIICIFKGQLVRHLAAENYYLSFSLPI